MSDSNLPKTRVPANPLLSRNPRSFSEVIFALMLYPIEYSRFVEARIIPGHAFDPLHVAAESSPRIWSEPVPRDLKLADATSGSDVELCEAEEAHLLGPAAAVLSNSIPPMGFGKHCIIDSSDRLSPDHCEAIAAAWVRFVKRIFSEEKRKTAGSSLATRAEAMLHFFDVFYELDLRCPRDHVAWHVHDVYREHRHSRTSGGAVIPAANSMSFTEAASELDRLILHLQKPVAVATKTITFSEAHAISGYNRGNYFKLTKGGRPKISTAGGEMVLADVVDFHKEKKKRDLANSDGDPTPKQVTAIEQRRADERRRKVEIREAA